MPPQPAVCPPHGGRGGKNNGPGATVFAFNWANTHTRVLKKLDYVYGDSPDNLAPVKSEFVTMIFVVTLGLFPRK